MKATKSRTRRKQAGARGTVQEKAPPKLGFEQLYVKPPKPKVKAKVTSKGQITLPQYLRHELGLRDGDEVEFEFVEDHGWRIRRFFDREEFERILKRWRGTIHPAFKGMTTDEIIEEMRGPVDLG